MMNSVKTTILLAAMTVLIILIGQSVGGREGMIFAFFLAAAMNFGSYWYSDKIVLKLYRAREVAPHEMPNLHSMVSGLSQRAGIPMPRIYVVPGDSPNAFATGRGPNHAAVAVTEGILNLLDKGELEGVLAHEISHIKNRDILISSIAATMAGAIMMIANMARWGAIFGGLSRDDDRGGGLGLLFVAILAPIAALIIQLAISRSREFLADSTGARTAGNPMGLASALEKLRIASARRPMRANPATAHMFIVNPLSTQSLAGLFSTHPPVEKRVERLRRMML